MSMPSAPLDDSENTGLYMRRKRYYACFDEERGHFEENMHATATRNFAFPRATFRDAPGRRSYRHCQSCQETSAHCSIAIPASLSYA